MIIEYQKKHQKQNEASYVLRQRRNIFQLPSGIRIHPQNNFFVIFSCLYFNIILIRAFIFYQVRAVL